MQRDPSTFSNAGIFRRIAAFTYDLVLVSAILMAGSMLVTVLADGEVESGNIPATLFMLSLPTLFYTWCWTRSGQTLGMLAWRLYLCDLQGKVLDWKKALARFLLAALLSAPGLLWMLANRDRQALYDIWNGSRLVMLEKK